MGYDVDGQRTNRTVPVPASAASEDEETHRGVEVDEDGARHVFAAAGLGEEGLEGARLANVLGIRIEFTVDLEAMLQEVAVAVGAFHQTYLHTSCSWLGLCVAGRSYSSQALLPSCVPAWPM